MHAPILVVLFLLTVGTFVDVHNTICETNEDAEVILAVAKDGPVVEERDVTEELVKKASKWCDEHKDVKAAPDFDVTKYVMPVSQPRSFSSSGIKSGTVADKQLWTYHALADGIVYFKVSDSNSAVLYEGFYFKIDSNFEPISRQTLKSRLEWDGVRIKRINNLFQK